jgi:hypothetical protein
MWRRVAGPSSSKWMVILIIYQISRNIGNIYDCIQRQKKMRQINHLMFMFVYFVVIFNDNNFGAKFFCTSWLKYEVLHSRNYTLSTLRKCIIDSGWIQYIYVYIYSYIYIYVGTKVTEAKCFTNKQINYWIIDIKPSRNFIGKICKTEFTKNTHP